MTALPKAKMTVDEFLVWAEDWPDRYELVDGKVYAMWPERAQHARVKFAVQTAFAQVIRRAGLLCEALPDGMTVRADEQTAYEPDALVYCGARLGGEAGEVPNPTLVIEVPSPSNGPHDTGAKLAGYFQVTSVQHYPIVDPARKLVIHHRRATDMIETRIASEGLLPLDPPGIKLAVEVLFAED
jgi:Uma2 family endonuclease